MKILVFIKETCNFLKCISSNTYFIKKKIQILDTLIIK